MVVAPWAGKMRRLEDGTVGQGPADDRPIEAVAAEIACAAPERDQGDGSTPPDLDEALRRCIKRYLARHLFRALNRLDTT
jgi:hypothetical protein